MLRYNENRMGTLTIEQNGQEFEIQIRQGNCLAVFIHVSRENRPVEFTEPNPQ